MRCENIRKNGTQLSGPKRESHDVVWEEYAFSHATVAVPTIVRPGDEAV